MLMKKIIFLSVFYLVSCSQSNEKDSADISQMKKTEQQDSLPKVENRIKEIESNVIKTDWYEYRDTIISDSVIFDVDLSSWKIEENFSNDSLAYRIEDTLFIRCKDHTVALIDEVFDETLENFDASQYLLSGLYPQWNLAEVSVLQYEYDFYVLVDLNTGDTLHSIGKALMSPSLDYIFSPNEDLEVGFTYNGYEVFKSIDGHYKRIKMVLIDDWGITQAKWMNENELLIQKKTIDDQYNAKYQYGVLKLKEH